MTQLSNFQRVVEMNRAFGNDAGASLDKVRSQCVNIGHEFVELLVALGMTQHRADALLFAIQENAVFVNPPDKNKVRDALCDMHVFEYGAHHFMDIDADADMNIVLDAIMTRFIKDDEDKAATIAKHAAKGVTQVYFEGDYPKMIMKSAVAQPDAPQGKFLKSASYSEPVFK